MTLIEVQTDGGLVGVTAAEARSETAIAIDRFVTPHLIGRDAAVPEQLTRILQDAEILGPPVYCVEIALWDIAGKAAGLPVSTMWGRFADRIPAYCLSYGGFMTNWMLANHPGVFKAAVSENPVTDLLAEWASSDFGFIIGRRAIEVQNPWENIGAFLARSPSTHMHQNHAPLLLLQAENDLRCPPGNSEMVFNILRILGREVEMIRYPGESHVMLIIGRPDRRVDRLERIVGWFQKHLAES